MNNTDLNNHSLEHDVMDAIHSGRVHMRPRWKFILSGVLAALGLIILLFTLLFIASFSIFVLRQTGVMFTPDFGEQGFLEFISALPFILLLLLAIFLIVLELLVRRYRVGYRMPLLISVLAILAIVVLGGYAIERTHVHELILRQAQVPGELPMPIELVYREGAQHVPNVYHGTISAVISGGFLLADDDGAGTTTVLIGPGTQLSQDSSFEPGEEVVVFGAAASGSVHAFGIKKISD